MEIQQVVATTFPYDRDHDLYQEYYRRALKAVCSQQGIDYAERSGSRSDAALTRVRRLRHSYKLRRWMAGPAGSVADGVAGMLMRGPLKSPTGPGLYQVHLRSGQTLRFAVDARDAGTIDEKLAAEVDVYFKSNFWPTLRYPANVLPVPNMNPLVARDLAYFTGLRTTPKTLDLFALIRVWGGSDEVEGVEHNLRLIEALARVPCTKHLCAYLVAGDIPAIGQRLTAQGITWTTEPMLKHDLWRLAAQSRLNIVRLGMHECVPWRMTDILAMGGCPVIDYGPQTLWPVPLLADRDYISLHTPPGATDAFAEIPGRLAPWLGSPDRMETMSQSTAAYFDAHLTPARLGAHLLATLQAHLGIAL